MLGFYGIKICHYSINPSEGNMYCSSVVSILKHTKLLRLQSEPLFTKYVLECRVLLHDMIELILYPVICTSVLSPHVHPTVRPFDTLYAVFRLSLPIHVLSFDAKHLMIDFCTFNLVTDQLCDLFF